jgi:hypothetical protein
LNIIVALYDLIDYAFGEDPPKKKTKEEKYNEKQEKKRKKKEEKNPAMVPQPGMPLQPQTAFPAYSSGQLPPPTNLENIPSQEFGNAPSPAYAPQNIPPMVAPQNQPPAYAPQTQPLGTPDEKLKKEKEKQKLDDLMGGI